MAWLLPKDTRISMLNHPRYYLHHLYSCRHLKTTILRKQSVDCTYFHDALVQTKCFPQVKVVASFLIPHLTDYKQPSTCPCKIQGSQGPQQTSWQHDSLIHASSEAPPCRQAAFCADLPSLVLPPLAESSARKASQWNLNANHLGIEEETWWRHQNWLPCLSTIIYITV